MPGPRVVVIDNYDSFVYNLVQYLGELGAEPIVHRHDAVTLDEMDPLPPHAVLVAPRAGAARGRRSLERRHRPLRLARHARARRVPRPAVHRSALRRRGRAGAAG